jgi:hypothetical protein
MTTPTSALAPPGWRFERIDDRHIRVIDPAAPYAVVLDLSDQAPVMRVFWRLASAFVAPVPQASN